MAAKTTKIEITKATAHQFAEGLQAVVPDGVTLLVAKTPISKEHVIARFTACAPLFTRVTELELALKQAEAARDAGVADVEEFANTLAPMLVAMFGPDEASKCGIATAKAPTPLSTEKRALKKARIQATREARGTTSKKQKASIHGVVPEPAANTSNVPGHQ